MDKLPQEVIDKIYLYLSYDLVNKLKYKSDYVENILHKCRDKAARIIQKNCHDLLWGNNHNGKPGLMVQKMLKQLPV